MTTLGDERLVTINFIFCWQRNIFYAIVSVKISCQNKLLKYIYSDGAEAIDDNARENDYETDKKIVIH